MRRFRKNKTMLRKISLKSKLIRTKLGLDCYFKGYPFFKYRDTVRHIRFSKVFFIMRGLPGSGKSTVVQEIKSHYKDAIICSADDYFFQEDGTYAFDVNKLSMAHELCYRKVQRAVERGLRHVVVDNTNILRWEMSKYFRVAETFDYTVLVVEPKTPWKLTPKELAARNTHSCTEEMMQKKQKNFSPIYPIYWGWFLNERTSKELLSLGETCFNLCMRNVPEFADYLKQLAISKELGSDISFKNYFHRNSSGNVSLHCTSFFSGSRKDRSPATEEYASRAEVQKSLGKAFNLKLVGVMITPRTVGIRVLLNKNQLLLWGGGDKWSPQPPPKPRVDNGDNKEEFEAQGSHNSRQTSAHSGGLKSEKPSKKDRIQSLVSSPNSDLTSGNPCEEENTDHDISLYSLDNFESLRLNSLATQVAETLDGDIKKPNNPNKEGNADCKTFISLDIFESWKPNSPTTQVAETLDIEIKQTPLVNNKTDIHVESNESVLQTDSCSQNHVQSCCDDVTNELYHALSSDPTMSVNNSSDSLSMSDKADKIEETDKEEIPLKHGSRAHITLGFAEGYSAVYTGFDQMELLLCEENGSLIGDPVMTDDVTIMHYGEGRCVVYFDWPRYKHALFSGKY